ncbi:peptidase domain-containing ABC transporter [Mucilaginibacter sp.]|uniref:peptidase domain-containing ABC transporter n=1 Tax=Mucilaginibacter sp. TaxID=1882438 RepID=UPI002618EEFF|nr:peptidase domain-containing ABC transporter [Mucilaginibacter sp.]MDB4926574.1 apxIB 3 [Mucilaginibacter sp.]
MFNRFPFYNQYDRMDCGPTCLRMIASYYGKDYSLNYLRKVCHISRAGISLEGLKVGSEKIGFKAIGVSLPFDGDEQSLQSAPLPCIAFWRQQHFVVIYKTEKDYIYIADPAKGKIKLTTNQFATNWIVDNTTQGIALLLIPTEAFQTTIVTDPENNSDTLKFFGGYLKSYKKYIYLIIISLLTGSVLLLLFPFLTKAVVDVGITNKNLYFIYILLLAQLILYTSQTALNFFQRWLILHISSRVNILLSSDFVYKLTKLPIHFFDTKQFGDLFQRINDHRKIETFFTASSLSVVLSVFNIIVFGIVLAFYNPLIFAVFLLGSVVYFIWIFYFTSKKRIIDYQLFQESSNNSDMLYELIQGMQEIKLQNSEEKRTVRWAKSQERLFKINVESNIINQYQDGGAFFITQLKDILINIIAAIAVIKGNMSLGMLIATQFIIGQLNGPIQQIVAFIRNGYEAKLSLNRIVEVHDKLEEDAGKKNEPVSTHQIQDNIMLDNLSFRYNELTPYVLKNVTLKIPKGKVTAIVGSSGSGKTTLVKLLLGFYTPTQGTITVGSTNIETLTSKQWRSQCGAVMQDGFIFSDTIANNIAESDTKVDWDKLKNAVEVANIKDYIESLSLNFNTQIGAQGNGISQGQRQRILISRAVYKDSYYLFFDEATNALDANNEKIIIENLEKFYKTKTVIIVAHRLSTVKNADQIIVLENGQIVEQGNHTELIANRANYYELVKNQLELGN